jgi:hypothetical protein
LRSQQEAMADLTSKSEPSVGRSGSRRRKSNKFVVPKRRKKKNPNQTPGPGEYDISGLHSYSGGRSTFAPSFGFGTAARTQKAGRGKTELMGLDSPGPSTYDVSYTTRRDGGMKGRLKKGAFSFPGEQNRPSPFQDQRSPGPIYYYPDCEADSELRTAPKWSTERTNHNQGMGRIGAKSDGPGPVYNLRNGRVGTKVLAIGDVTHKTAQWATCGARMVTTEDRAGRTPGPASYDPADMDLCSQNSEAAPRYTMRNWTPYGDLPKRPPPKKFVRGRPPTQPPEGPKYDVSARDGGVLPNKANPPQISFGKDERFWDDA